MKYLVIYKIFNEKENNGFISYDNPTIGLAPFVNLDEAVICANKNNGFVVKLVETQVKEVK